MAVIRLYKKFYRISCNLSGDTYSLIDPTFISANVYLKDSSTLIESVSDINKESTGIYFVNLIPNFYSYDNVYDLKWTIRYSQSSPTKTLTTSFRLNPINIIGSEIYTEFENQIINLEINNQEINTNIENNIINTQIDDKNIGTSNNEIIDVIIL